MLLGRGKTISRVLFEDARDFFKATYCNNKTKQIYTYSYKKFLTFCRQEHNAKTKEDCFNCINSYINHLKLKNYSPSTIHTFLSAICQYHEVPMNNYDKPKRFTSENKRGRVNNGRINRSDNSYSNPKFELNINST